MQLPTFPPPRPPLRRGALWLNISSGVPHTALDATVRRFLFTRMPNLVVLNGEQQGYAALVQATRAQFARLKILRYANAQLVPEGSRVASTMFQHFLVHAGSQLLKRRSDGAPRITGGPGQRTAWVDITSTAARQYIVAHLAGQVAAHGVDGVAIDSFHAQLRNSKRYLDGAVKAEQWPLACRRLLQALRIALPGKLIWFNGLWSFNGQAQIDAQAALLPYADGASVEFFGYDGRDRNPPVPPATFATFVEPINAVLRANPAKPILVHGTSRGRRYFDYRTDLQHARYTYGCYLLAKTQASFFNYGQSFQLRRLPDERAAGVAMYSYIDLPLGKPTTEAIPNGSGGWARGYAGAGVFVAPADGPSQAWMINIDRWTTTGEKHAAGSALVVAAGDAAFRLYDRPTPPPAQVEIDLAGSSNEWWIDGVTSEFAYGILTLRLRSSDPASAVLVRFETDDAPHHPFGILWILPVAGTFAADNCDYPYRQPPWLGAARVISQHRYPTGGEQVEIGINLQADCAPLPCYRVISARTFGAVEVSRMRLGRPQVIV